MNDTSVLEMLSIYSTFRKAPGRFAAVAVKPAGKERGALLFPEVRIRGEKGG